MKFFHLIFIYSMFVTVIFAQDYSMKDLEVLQKRNNYTEFFLHAKDIRPSQRQAEWTKMVESMSEKYLKEILSRPFITEKEFEIVNSLSNWTIILENQTFKYLRSKFGTLYFKNCFKDVKNSTSCYQKAIEFIKKTPDQFQMATDIGKVIYDFKLKYKLENSFDLKLWPFFKKMAKKPISEFYCGKLFFQNEVLTVISKDINTLNPEQLKNQIDNNIHNDCWKKLKKYFMVQLNSNSQALSTNAYYFLSSKKELSEYENTKFLIYFLLGHAPPGEILTTAWSKLIEIKKDYHLREKLLNDFKNLDPLPGKVFKYFYEKRSLVIIKAISKNFPEYFDYYSQTCLSYLEGSKDFPNGNPTIECKELFNTAQKYSLLPKMLLKRYQAARNFKSI